MMLPAAFVVLKLAIAPDAPALPRVVKPDSLKLYVVVVLSTVFVVTVTKYLVPESSAFGVFALAV